MPTSLVIHKIKVLRQRSIYGLYADTMDCFPLYPLVFTQDKKFYAQEQKLLERSAAPKERPAGYAQWEGGTHRALTSFLWQVAPITEVKCGDWGTARST